MLPRSPVEEGYGFVGFDDSARLTHPFSFRITYIVTSCKLENAKNRGWSLQGETASIVST